MGPQYGFSYHFPLSAESPRLDPGAFLPLQSPSTFLKRLSAFFGISARSTFAPFSIFCPYYWPDFYRFPHSDRSNWMRGQSSAVKERFTRMDVAFPYGAPVPPRGWIIKRGATLCMAPVAIDHGVFSLQKWYVSASLSFSRHSPSPPFTCWRQRRITLVHQSGDPTGTSATKFVMNHAPITQWRSIPFNSASELTGLNVIRSLARFGFCDSCGGVLLPLKF